MEQLSRAFLRALATNEGFTCEDHQQDFGVDCSVHEASSQARNGRTRILLSGRSMQVQLKAVTESKVRAGDRSLHFDLESKTFNDLVSRARGGATTPLVLGLLVLPDDRAEWAVVQHHQLEVRHSFYLWAPPTGTTPTPHAASVTIEVDLTKQVFTGSFRSRFEEHVP
jgi:hypothetical protein